MIKLVAIALSFLTFLKSIFDYIFGKKFAISAIAVVAQTTFLAFYWTLKFGLVVAFVIAFKDIFSLLIFLLDTFQNLDTKYPDIFGVPFKILTNLGLFDAINYYFPLFVTLTMLLFSSILIKAFLKVNETMSLFAYRIGMLSSSH